MGRIEEKHKVETLGVGLLPNEPNDEKCDATDDARPLRKLIKRIKYLWYVRAGPKNKKLVYKKCIILVLPCGR